MTSGTTATAAPTTVIRHDLLGDFLSLVYADDDLVRAEFDELIGAVWDIGQSGGPGIGQMKMANAGRWPNRNVRGAFTTAVPPGSDPSTLGRRRQRAPP
jgi:hypothetical protein